MRIKKQLTVILAHIIQSQTFEETYFNNYTTRFTSIIKHKGSEWFSLFNEHTPLEVAKTGTFPQTLITQVHQNFPKDARNGSSPKPSEL